MENTFAEKRTEGFVCLDLRYCCEKVHRPSAAVAPPAARHGLFSRRTSSNDTAGTLK